LGMHMNPSMLNTGASCAVSEHQRNNKKGGRRADVRRSLSRRLRARGCSPACSA
jgi:hypothetical protein